MNFLLNRFHLLRRPGSDLLSHTLRCSTIGAKGFHGRVRDGIGWFTLAITTRSSKKMEVIKQDLLADKLDTLAMSKFFLRAFKSLIKVYTYLSDPS